MTQFFSINYYNNNNNNNNNNNIIISEVPFQNTKYERDRGIIVISYFKGSTNTTKLSMSIYIYIEVLKGLCYGFLSFLWTAKIYIVSQEIVAYLLILRRIPLDVRATSAKINYSKNYS